jgi:hypothetical protein
MMMLDVQPHCEICRRLLVEESPLSGVCRVCFERYPVALVQAHLGGGRYMARLTSGELVCFVGARIRGRYVDLYGDRVRVLPIGGEGLPLPCPDGVSVSVANIVWCAQVPGNPAEARE